MAENFDAYHKWLGIPPEEQPPDHYRLLGVQQFETDVDVIERGADRQMTYLRSLTFAEHVDLAQKLLGEVSVARICLTSPDKKEAYDLQLREEQPAESEEPIAQPIRSPLPIRSPSPGRIAAASAGLIPVRAVNSPRANKPTPANHSPAVAASTGSRYRRRSEAWHVPVAIGVAMFACVVVVLMLISAGQGPDDNSGENSLVTHKKRTHRSTRNRKKPKPAASKPANNTARSIILPSIKKQPDDNNRPAVETLDEPDDLPTTDPALSDNNSPDPTTEDPATPGPTPSDPLDTPVDPDDPFDLSPPRDDPSDSSRLAVPTADVQKTIEQQIRDLYADDFKDRSPRGKWELGKKLLQLGKETRDDPQSRFVLLRMARDIAVKSGDIPTAMSAIGQLGRSYDVDALAMKSEALLTANKTSVPAQVKSHLVRSLLKRVRENVQADRFDVAVKLADAYAPLARSLRDKQLIVHSTVLRKEVRQIKQAFDQLAPALEKLADSPDDPQANLAAGQFYCLIKGDWQRGLPLLAAGEESPQQALAQRELAGTEDPAGQISLADGWWDDAEKAENALAKRRGRGRAAYWYRKALEQTSGGLAKKHIEKRLSEVDQKDPLEFVNYSVPPGAVLLFSFERETFFRSGKNYLVRDLSGHGNHGLIRGALPAEGKAGGGVELGKGRSIECRHQNSLNPAPAITLAIWFKCNSMRDYSCLIAKQNKNSGGFVLRSEKESRYGFVVGEKEWKYVKSTSQFQEDVWYHLAASFDGKTMRLYVDGKQNSETPTDSSIVPSNLNLRIGHANHNKKSGQFFGIVDEVAIFNRALSANEIRGLYKMGTEGRSIRH